MLAVSGKALGRKKPLFDDFHVPPPATAEGQTLTLTALLGHVVRAEVEAFRGRQQERKLLKVLTAADLDAGLAAGKVFSGGCELEQHVDTDAAIAAAVEAFADGLFLVVLDGEEVRDLNAPLAVAADSRLTFIRLALLAGG